MNRTDWLIVLGISASLIVIFYMADLDIKEPITELYFDNYNNLPVTPVNIINVSFAVKNLEYKSIKYQIQIFLDNYKNGLNTNKSIKASEYNVTLAHGKEQFFFTNITIPNGFESAKMRIVLLNQNISIHLFADSAKYFTLYEFGYVKQDCVNLTLPISKPNKLIVDGFGSNANGLPVLSLFIDGKFIENKTILSSLDGSYTYKINLSKGIHLVDLDYDNDYINTTKLPNGSSITIDRNIYINNITIGNYKISPYNLLYDLGRGRFGFDCFDTRLYNNSLYAPGALRFNIESI